MATIKELQEKRENLKIQILANFQDFREYIKSPVCSVDIEQIKYQIDFGIREIKDIDYKINLLLGSDREKINADFKNLETLLKLEQSKTKFDSAYLPKNHYSLWQNSK